MHGQITQLPDDIQRRVSALAERLQMSEDELVRSLLEDALEFADPQDVEPEMTRLLFPETEVTDAIDFINQYGEESEEARADAWSAFCQLLFLSNEFTYIN